MFEFSHEANVAYEVCCACIGQLQNLTVKTPARTPAEARDFGDQARKHINELAGAFEMFVAGATGELRKKGLFPTVLPAYRKVVVQQSVKEMADIPNSGDYAGSPLGTTNHLPPIGGLRSTSTDAYTTRADTQISQYGPPSPEKVATAQPPTTIEEKDAAAGTTLLSSGQQVAEKRRFLDGLFSSKGVQAPARSQGAVAESDTPIGLPSYMPTTGSLGQGSGKGPALGIGCCNAPNETIDSLVATSLYFHFEVLVRQVLAKEAALFLYQPGAKGRDGDEAQAIALFGGKPRPPNNVKVAMKSGVVGAVMRTGFAVNINPENTSETNCYALCFPIFPVSGRSAPIGAVLLEKKASNTPFTKDDEAVTHQWCKLVSHFITEFDVNLTQVYYDPHRTLLRKLKPLQGMLKRGRKQATPKWIESGPGGTNENIEQLMQRYSGVYSVRLAQLVAAHPTNQMLFRTVHHNHFTAIRGSHLGGSGVTLQTQNLSDVAEYVGSLEECWKRAADDLQGMEVEHVSRMDDFRDRKKKLKATQIRMGQLESVCDTYKTKYEGIKRELTVLCGAEVDEDPTHFGGHSLTQFPKPPSSGSKRGSVIKGMGMSGSLSAREPSMRRKASLKQ